MEKGDISVFSTPTQACVFEGLLASPPTSLRSKLRGKFLEASGDWEAIIKGWTPNELPLKSMIDGVNRRGINTLVVTFLSPEAVEPIYKWLTRKGVSPVVEYYPTPESFAEDLKFDWSIKNVFVPDQLTASIIGFRATTVSSTTNWTF